MAGQPDRVTLQAGGEPHDTRVQMADMVLANLDALLSGGVPPTAVA